MQFKAFEKYLELWKSREEIIDELAVHGKERKDVQLILGVALQETGRFKEAFDVFCDLADSGSVAGKFQKATYLYDGNNVEKDQKTAIALMDEVMTIAKEEGLTDLYRSSAECLGKFIFRIWTDRYLSRKSRLKSIIFSEFRPFLVII